MSAPTDISPRASYPAQLLTLSGRALAQLVRTPSHSRRAEAARKLARHSLWLSAAGAALVIALMVVFDLTEIQLMPARGAPGLWPIRILTDFGKDEYVLSVLGGLLVVLALVAAGLHGTSRALLLGLGTRLQFMFLSVAVPVFVAEILKYLIGRGRPFVGGKANPFNFVPFEGTGAYASLPSGHAVTAFALAFAVSALWPRLRVFMFTYAIVILLTRLVLLAHHPSDVVAGALVGLVGALAVRYWFAARRLGFAIRADGTIVPLAGAVSGRLKRVAHGASAP
ncbi:membrane-associated phospholipid phosphatase [Bradyrhizobium sp. GM2.2]|jgi:membrane-associated phospholipid phosphatase|uniref:phosphatase PAP2 family protein n=1 Tax=unclassified Bradyrhizobium TaxID=2631580 RepID=UPI001FF87A79|nr:MULTISPECIES: phosphatase PAP2 family protein [unclassified Bradyrhizobium]MCK1267329.1 phosphatase PAP2 family protein [Bradyrhizobium sp. 84]MCK1290023.1 phosphatase PAP2 family protein [Bradyrhizobium sp. 30]MCK1304981.1 phosphatase PAP2 family protein [Bradyrhizobium sp. 45]MCK1374458.1 phosphatase PAP2 family protein [Bradyrhizobium sp. 49]MCK1429083.1 phosphatase PAP2 family protein [Bradyrhizobium sp. 87]